MAELKSLIVSGSSTMNNTLSIFGQTGSWIEGIRLHEASNEWQTLIFCGSDNTGSTGTSAKSWSLHNHGGTFYFANNGSSSYSNGLSWTTGGTLAITSSAAFTYNGYTIYHTGNLSPLTTSNWSSYCAAASHTHAYLPLTGGTVTGQVIFTYNSDNAIKIGTIRGYGAGSCTGEYIHMYERVHIGSPSGWGSREAPSYGLSTYGGAWLATDTGNVGIGTTDPSEKLDVYGTIKAKGVSTATNVAYQNFIRIFGIYSAENDNADKFGSGSYGTSSHGILFDGYWVSNSTNYYRKIAGIYAYPSSGWRGGLVFKTKNSSSQSDDPDVISMVMTPSGRVGINTTSPNSTLDINGQTTISYAASNGSPALLLKLTSTSNTYPYGLDIQGSNTTEGVYQVIWLGGITHSTNDQASCLFQYNGHNSNNNKVGFGFFNNDNLLNIVANGNVGIGTTSPSTKLDIQGCVSVFPGNLSSWNEGIRIHASDSGLSTLVLCGADNTGASGTSTNTWSLYNYGGNLYINRNGSYLHTGYEIVNVSGNVGIGLVSPSYKLDVSGSVNATTLYENGTALSSKYQAASTAINTSNISSQSVNYATSSTSATTASQLAGISSGGYFRRYDWWYEGESHNVDTLRGGTTFVYTSHSAPVTGTLAAFDCSTNEAYTLQILGQYSGEALYFRNRNGDNGTWGTWRNILHSNNYTSYINSTNFPILGYSASSFAAASHTHSYLPLAGGTVTGTITSTYYGPAFYANISSGWAYTRYQSSSEFWDTGTNSSAGGCGNSGGFGIRQDGEDNNGIYVKRSSSAYGKLVVAVPSGECSIGYWSTNSNPASNYPVWTVGYTGADNLFGWYYSQSGGWKMTLNPSGSLTIAGSVSAGSGFYDTSDARLKNFHNDISIDFDKLKSIPKKYFSWKSDEENRLHIGTSAQEVQKIYPEIVNQSSTGELSVDYSKLSIISLAAIDKHEDRIEMLENEIIRLKNRIKELEEKQ